MLFGCALFEYRANYVLFLAIFRGKGVVQFSSLIYKGIAYSAGYTGEIVTKAPDEMLVLPTSNLVGDTQLD